MHLLGLLSANGLEWFDSKEHRIKMQFKTLQVAQLCQMTTIPTLSENACIISCSCYLLTYDLILVAYDVAKIFNTRDFGAMNQEKRGKQEI